MKECLVNRGILNFGGVLIKMFICSYLLFVVRYGWFLSRTESFTAVSSLPDLFFTLVEGTRSWEKERWGEGWGWEEEGEGGGKE